MGESTLTSSGEQVVGSKKRPAALFTSQDTDLGGISHIEHEATVTARLSDSAAYGVSKSQATDWKCDPSQTKATDWTGNGAQSDIHKSSSAPFSLPIPLRQHVSLADLAEVAEQAEATDRTNVRIQLAEAKAEWAARMAEKDADMIAMLKEKNAGMIAMLKEYNSNMQQQNSGLQERVKEAQELTRRQMELSAQSMVKSGTQNSAPYRGYNSVVATTEAHTMEQDLIGVHFNVNK